ncbi:MAG: hypothetical protein EZS28_022924 [Streblomastix strix]|uniref:Uncharacterized protein n=1 Tax=Streblomastix strix TaxID=222440 RepID=A0A5J4VG37_9EUKA|nr:MAG: hypothetical protein EZS28_022924 [Streblomastix strix]
MKIRKKKQRRPKSAPIIMTKKKISEKDLKRMIDLREKERKKKELEIQKEIERLKEIELREKEKLKEQDKVKEKQSKQAFVPLVIHPPVLKLNDDTLQQVSLDNQLKASISTESASKQGINQTQVQSSTLIVESDSQRKINQEQKDAQSVFDELFDKQVKQAQSSEQIGKQDISKSDFKVYEDQMQGIIPSSIDMKSEIQTARSIQQMATMFQGRQRTNSINDQIKEVRPKIIYKRNYSHKPPILTRIPHELLELSHRVLYNLQSRQESRSESKSSVRASQADISTMNESTTKNNQFNVLLKDDKTKISSPNIDILLPRTWSEEAQNVLESIGIKQQDPKTQQNQLKESNINNQGENKTNLDNISNSSLQPINNIKINNIDNDDDEEEEEDSEDKEEDENELPSIRSILPSQGSLDQMIDDTFAIHDQLPSNRGDKIVALMEQYSYVMQAPLLSDEDAFLCASIIYAILVRNGVLSFSPLFFVRNRRFPMFIPPPNLLPIILYEPPLPTFTVTKIQNAPSNVNSSPLLTYPLSINQFQYSNQKTDYEINDIQKRRTMKVKLRHKRMKEKEKQKEKEKKERARLRKIEKLKNKEKQETKPNQQTKTKNDSDSDASTETEVVNDKSNKDASKTKNEKQANINQDELSEDEEIEEFDAEQDLSSITQSSVITKISSNIIEDKENYNKSGATK